MAEKSRSGQSVQDLREEILRLTAEYASIAHVPGVFDKNNSPAPVAGRVYGQDEMVALVDSALDFWLTSGRFDAEFEQRLGQYLGRRHTLTVNSGSSANLLAFSALTSSLLGERALKAGDEVITCATGFPTTISPILIYGLTPVFLDVDIPTYNIDVTALEEAVSDRTRAIMLAHAMGNPFNLDQVMALARKHDLYVIEDNCDALSARYHGQLTGSFGDISTQSFYPAHHITMGEGGAVTTDNARFKRIMNSLRNWGRDCYCVPGKDNTCGRRFGWQLGDLPHDYDHKNIYTHPGFNLKITDMQAAVGLAQLSRVADFHRARQENFTRLLQRLESLQEYFILPAATPGSEPCWFGLVLTVRDDAPFTRNDMVRHLTERRVGTRLLFGGNLTRQPLMSGRRYRSIGALENADAVMHNSFWIGVYPGLSNAHLDYMLEVITDFVKR